MESASGASRWKASSSAAWGSLSPRRGPRCPRRHRRSAVSFRGGGTVTGPLRSPRRSAGPFKALRSTRARVDTAPADGVRYHRATVAFAGRGSS